MVPLLVFDTNYHPIFDPRSGVPEAVQLVGLESKLRSRGVMGALSVDLPGLNSHLSHESFILAHSRSSFFTPVPAIRMGTSPRRQVDAILRSGAKLIKVHPRLLGLNYDSRELKRIIRDVTEAGLGLLLCCYPYSRFSGTVRGFHLSSILDFLAPKSGFKNTLLMHGGGPQFLEVAEWARHQEGILLDLSFTLTQFAKTSVALDMRGAALRFEERMTVGSDSPHEDLDQWVYERDKFLQDIPDESRCAISSENILKFLRRL